MGLVPNPEFIIIYTKVIQVYSVLELSYTDSGVGLLQTGFPSLSY
jgi:hypothetical protein